MKTGFTAVVTDTENSLHWTRVHSLENDHSGDHGDFHSPRGAMAAGPQDIGHGDERGSTSDLLSATPTFCPE